MASVLPQPTAFGVQMAPQRPIAAPLDLTAFGGPPPDVGASLLAQDALRRGVTPPKPTNTPVATTPSPLSAGVAGMQAGQLGTQAYDTTSGIASALGAGAAGAAAGAAAGPVGAAVGGGVGLLVGGLNAWMSVGKENKANRDRRKLLAETKAEQKRRDDIARADATDQLAFDRKQLEEAKRLEDWNRNRGLIAEARAKSKARAEEFISRGYTT